MLQDQLDFTQEHPPTDSHFTSTSADLQSTLYRSHAYKTLAEALLVGILTNTLPQWIPSMKKTWMSQTSPEQEGEENRTGRGRERECPELLPDARCQVALLVALPDKEAKLREEG